MSKVLKYSCLWLLAVALFWPTTTRAQDSTKNCLKLDVNFLSRGELRYGGLPEVGDETDDHARFAVGRTRLILGYERPHLEAHVTAQHSGVWGQDGSFSLYETWFKLKANNGLFAQVGRQELNYDDERILGGNDWSVASNSHDALRMGYEGHGHKLHLILAYNQRSQNINGGSTYRTDDGTHPYKSMVAAWYHYDWTKIPLGASLLFLNLGVQNQQEENPKTESQQSLGLFVNYHPERWNVEAAYYRQMGKDEFHIPIKAWMASLKLDYIPSSQWKLTAGYDYLSGDDNPVIPKIGEMGMALHKQVNGFTTLYGSHHQFYGAMEFFYLSGYYGGYTPGLQNIYFGINYKPITSLSLNAAYHYMRTASKIDEASPSLGHEWELSAGYTIIKDVKLSAGYTYMHGTSTLERLQRIEGKNKLHWGWLMLTVNPTIFTKRW